MSAIINNTSSTIPTDTLRVIEGWWAQYGKLTHLLRQLEYGHQIGASHTAVNMQLDIARKLADTTGERVGISKEAIKASSRFSREHLEHLSPSEGGEI